MASSDSEAQSSSALHAQRLSRFIQDGRENGQLGVHERLFAAQYHFDPSNPPRSIAGSEVFESSSMALSSASYTSYSYRGSTNPPSLASSYHSNTSYTSSVGTSNAAYQLSRLQIHLPNSSDDDANLPEAVYACPFLFLGCDKSTTHFDEWETHCRWHFHNQLPRGLNCPMTGCTWVIDNAQAGEQRWQEYCSHIQASHGPLDQVDTRRRPSRDLVDHLWRLRIIDSAQAQTLSSNARIDGSVFLVSAGNERRRRGSVRRAGA